MAVTIETYHQDGQWLVRRHGQDEARSSHPTKQAAVTAGRSAATEEEAEHVIKNLDGRTQERNTYGNDPGDVPG